MLISTELICSRLGNVFLNVNLFSMSASIEWTPEAETRLKEIPFFVRPAARKKIEKFAQEMGEQIITPEIYEQAKQKFGSK